MKQQYHLRHIRALLTEGFTPEQLRRFCYDTPEFRPVYDQLAQGTGKAAIIDHLIEHAERYILFAPLLDWAKEENPTQYERYQPYEGMTADDQPAGHPSGGAQSRHRPSPLQRPRRAEHFTGREQELAQLLADLQPGQVVTLTGPGGIGKSALAAEAIWTLAPADAPPERFPDGIIFYSFYGQPDTALALEHLVRSFDETARDSSPQAAYRLLSGKQALIILDGAEAAADLRAVLDVTANCGVLVTSRKRSDAVAAPQPINPLPSAKAVTLLRAWGRTQVDDETAAQAICRLVGGLPLAVRLVGRYLTEQGETATEYLAWLQETPLQALNQGQRRDESVPYLIERSLAEVSVAANEVLAVTGLLALAPFSRAVVQAALPEVNTRRALGELVSYGLLLRTTERYETGHALIHTYARRRLVAPDEALIRLAEFYTKLAREQSQLGPPGYAVLDAERIHLVTVLERCVEREAWEVARSLAWGVEDYLDIQGHWTECVAVLEMGVTAAQALGHRRDEGAFSGNLGLAYSDLGQVEQAIDFHTQALAISREIGDRRAEGSILGNLGLAYSDLGQVERAIDFHTQALAISREIGNKQSEGNQLGNLGNAYSDLGQVEPAIDYYQQALAIAREIGDRRGEGSDLGNLGLAYRALGQVEQAIDFHTQALAISREIGDRRGEGNQLGNLGNAYRALGQVEQAIDFHTQALAIAREIGDRRGEAFHSWNLGLIYEESDPAQAVALMSVCVDYEREIGHPDAEADAKQVEEIKARM